MHVIDPFQYSSLVHLCNDIMETVCAPRRIQSILIAASEVSTGDPVTKEVISWTKAVSTAISRIKEDFKEFPDVVEPFVMALDQVCVCMSNVYVRISMLLMCASIRVCRCFHEVVFCCIDNPWSEFCCVVEVTNAGQCGKIVYVYPVR